MGIQTFSSRKNKTMIHIDSLLILKLLMTVSAYEMAINVIPNQTKLIKLVSCLSEFISFTVFH